MYSFNSYAICHSLTTNNCNAVFSIIFSLSVSNSFVTVKKKSRRPFGLLQNKFFSLFHCHINCSIINKIICSGVDHSTQLLKIHWFLFYFCFFSGIWYYKFAMQNKKTYFYDSCSRCIYCCLSWFSFLTL